MTASLNSHDEAKAKASMIQIVANKFTNWAERWFPDAYVFALAAFFIACLATLAIGGKPADVLDAFGSAYWNLIRFTYQMAMILISGYAIAMSSPIQKVLRAMAAVPKNGTQAAMFIITLSVIANLLNWGFGLIFSALFVLVIAQREDLKLDYRAAAAAGLAGCCIAGMLGLSSGPALLQANPSSMPPELAAAGGVIPTTETIFTWQNGVTIVVMWLATLLVAYFSTPRGDMIRTAADIGVDVKVAGAQRVDNEKRRPGDWLSHTPYLGLAFGLMSALWIALNISKVGFVRTISDLNNYIFISLTLALLLHGRIKSFLDAVYGAVPAVGPILIQFPIYAATAAIITTVKDPSGATIAHYLSHFFVNIGGHYLLPVVVGIYSIFMGFFIPAAGARWVLEAPYVFKAGQATEQNLGWLLMTFNSSEMLTTFLNPFWMLALLGILHLKPRNIVGYTFLYFSFLTPVCLFTLWALSLTFTYHPPVHP